MAPSPSSVRPESLPVVDLRLLSQSELFSLSHSSAARNDRDAIDDGLLIPKIDRSVFNESAGSRKQTFSRLRLAPSAAAAARRSLAHSRPPAPPGPDDLRVVELLKQLFASDSDDLVPVRVQEAAVPTRIVAGGSVLKVDVAGCENGAVVPANSKSLEFPRQVVLGLVSQDEESRKRKRGWPKTIPISLPVQDIVGLDSETGKEVEPPHKSGNSLVVENLGNSLAVPCISMADSLALYSETSKVEVESLPESENILVENGDEGFGTENSVNNLAVPCSLIADSVPRNSEISKAEPPPKIKNQVLESNPEGFVPEILGNSLAVPHISTAGSVAPVLTLPPNSASVAPILTPPHNSGSVAPVLTPPPNSGSVAPILTPPPNSASVAPILTPPHNSGSVAPVLTPPPNSGSVAPVLTPPPNSGSVAPVLTPPNSASVAPILTPPYNSGSVAPALTPPPNSGSVAPILTPPRNSASVAPILTLLPNSDSLASVQIPALNSGSSAPIQTPTTNAVSVKQKIHRPRKHLKTQTQNHNQRLVTSEIPCQEAADFSGHNADTFPKNAPPSSVPPPSNPPSDYAALPEPVPTPAAMAMNVENLLISPKVEALQESSASEAKRKRGRPRRGETPPVSSPRARVKKVVSEVKVENLERVNGNGTVVDLAALGTLEDPFGEELRRRSGNLATEAELMGFLEGVPGEWVSWRRKKRIVPACEFGDALPLGWKILLCLKRRDSRFWLICRRYVSPGGVQFDSCKEVSSYLINAFQPQQRDQSESCPADGNVQASTEVGFDLSMEQAPNISYEDPKRGSELVSCSRVPVTSAITDQGTPKSFLETMNPGEHGVANAKNSQHDSMLSFDERNGLDHQSNFTRANPHRDGVLTNYGKYQCQFCQSLFDDIGRYNDHVLVHAKNCSESNTILLQPTNMPERSPLSSSFSPTSLKIQEPIDINLEDSCSLEESGNLKVDTPYHLCAEKEIEETVSKSCTYSQNDGFVLFSNEERAPNCSKGDVDRESYEKRIKTSYLTNEELGKLDEPWLDMGFQGNLFAPFDVESLNNSSSVVVDMIRADDSRNCKASEYSVSFDHNQTRTRAVTSSSRTEQEDFSRGSSVLLSSYEHRYAFRDSPVPNKKQKEVKDKSFEPEHEGRSDHARYYDFINNKKVSSSSSVGSSRNKEVKEFWNDEALHDSRRVDTMIDTNSGIRTNVTRNSERVSHEIPGSGQVRGNSSNREQEVTRHFDFGFTYPPGAPEQQIHGIGATQNVFTNTLWDQPKLDANQFRHNVVASESAEDSRSSGDVMPGLSWRIDDQNFRSSRLPDTSSVQMSTSFPNYGLPRHKDVYAGNPGVSERFDNFSGFDGLGSATTQQQQSQYNFLGAQATPNLNDSRDLSPKQDFDSLFWFPKEDTIPFHKATVRHPTLTTCVWCRKEFYHQDVGSQMKSGSMGLMCTTCQTKFPG